MQLLKRMRLQLAGLGVIFYSPASVEHINEGEDYFFANYDSFEKILPHLTDGTIVCFGTGSPGDYEISFFLAEEDEPGFENAEFRLEIGLKVSDQTVCLKDVYELMEWEKTCPVEQQFRIEDGNYRMRLFSDRPSSGIIGDNQEISIYLSKVAKLPQMSFEDIPYLGPYLS